MKTLSERKALMMAVAAAGSALLATLGLAIAIRPVQFPPPPAGNLLIADVGKGRHLFLLNCAHCHGDDARGDEGPDLHNLHRSDARIHRVIIAGIKGEMPSFGKKLHDPEIVVITAYLRTLR